MPSFFTRMSCTWALEPMRAILEVAAHAVGDGESDDEGGHSGGDSGDRDGGDHADDGLAPLGFEVSRRHIELKSHLASLTFVACLFTGGTEDGFGYADIVVSIVDAHGDEVFSGFAIAGFGGNLKVVVLALRVGEFTDGVDVLPGPGIERVLGVCDGRGRVLCVEGYMYGSWAGRLRAFASASSACGALTTGGVVSISKRSLSLASVSASPGVRRANRKRRL